jgi:hypothetical protein
MMRGSFFITAGIMAALAAVSPSAYAAERITLSNGYDYLCDHHAEVNGHVRLYLSAGEDNYIEFRPRGDCHNRKTARPAASSKIRCATSNPSSAGSHSRHDAKLSPADLREMLTNAGHEHNLDVDLLASLVKAESGGNTRAVSRAGAQGLTQLMPATAKDMGVADSFKPDENVRGGATYLDAAAHPLPRQHGAGSGRLQRRSRGGRQVPRHSTLPRDASSMWRASFTSSIAACWRAKPRRNEQQRKQDRQRHRSKSLNADVYFSCSQVRN